MSEEAGVKDTKLSLGGQAIAKLLGGKHVKYDGGFVRSGRVEIYGHSTEEHSRCPECHRESRFIDEKQWNQSDRISINSVLNQTYSFPILSLVNRPSSSRTERYFLAVLTLLIFSEMRFFGRM